MILPALSLKADQASAPLLLPATYASPGASKTPDQGTQDAHGSNFFRGGTLAPVFWGLSVSGGGGIFVGGMDEFGAAQIPLFAGKNGALNFETGLAIGGAVGSAALSARNVTIYPVAATWSAGIATVYANFGNFAVPPAAGRTITVAGMTPSGYNGTFTLLSYTPATGMSGAYLTYTLAVDPGGPATVTGTLAIDRLWTISDWLVTRWSSAARQNWDAWLNCPGPFPGCFPNRADWPGGGTFVVYGCVTNQSLTAAGATYTAAAGPPFTSVSLSGGHGSGAAGFIWAVDGGGGIVSYTLTAFGTGYQVGDVLTWPGGDGNGQLTITAIDEYVYPKWVLSSAGWPHAGSGDEGAPWTNPANVEDDTYQIAVTLTWPSGGLLYWAVWGIDGSLARPWPDVMSPDGLTLPFIGEAPIAPLMSFGTPSGVSTMPMSFAGSTITLARIAKPASPYN